MAEKIQGLVSRYWESRLIHAFASLGIADVMAKEGAMSSRQIAKKVRLTRGEGPSLLYRMLRALSAARSQVVREVALDSFQLTESGKALRKGELRDMIRLELGETHRSVWEHAETILANGEQNGFPRAFGMGLFDFTNSTAPWASAYNTIFNSAMTSYSRAQDVGACKVCKELFPPGSIGKVVDVGGGPGALLREVVALLEAEKGVVQEQQCVVDNKPADTPDNVQFKVLDFFKEAEPGGDLYLMKMILHDWNDVQCSTILQNIRAAAPPGATLLVVEYVVPEPGVAAFAKAFDCHMMVVTDGRERTFDEYRQLLEGAGFEAVRLHDRGSIQCVEGRVPAAGAMPTD